MITGFFFGSGAIENAWEPIIRALNIYNPAVSDRYGANIEICRNVYLARLHYQNFSKRFAVTSNSAGLDLCMTAINRLNTIRKRISKEIAISQDTNELHIREEFENVFRSFVLNHSSKFTVVSTNWDSVGEKEIRLWAANRFGNTSSIAINRIHGDFENPDSMYMPLETYFEPYFGIKKFQTHAAMQVDLINNVRLAERLVIYGLSFSPLDIELFHTLDVVANELNGEWNTNLKEVVIVDLKPHDVYSNIRPAFRSGQTLTFTGYLPRQLDEAIFHD